MYVRMSRRAGRKGGKILYKEYKVLMSVLLLLVSLAFSPSFAISYSLKKKDSLNLGAMQ